MSLQPVYLSEHYWPGLAAELVLPQCQRFTKLDGLLAAVVLPGQQTAFGLFLAPDAESVRRATASVALTASDVAPGWLLTPSGGRAFSALDDGDRPHGLGCAHA